ncbi:DUF418 domain-containing protein [Microbacterium sp. bgisy189]|uniref:DUF418 domain-containing protein n=1 Tax=Microbacterium sp. bgisy189 TaxID=3413798 RepID=UPI003EC14482
MTTAAQPPAPSTRAIAPDVARGLMLLMIALANAPWLAFDVTRGFTLSHAKDAEGLDLAWQVISIIAIDGRSYPLFAFLFGYGIWQLYRRQYQSGIDERSARRLLQRRHLWMLAFGALHALLLWYGDIIGAYGLTGLIIVAALLGRSDKALKITAWILAGLIAMGAVFSVVSAIVLQFLLDGGIVDRAMFETGGFDPFALLAIDDYGLSMVVRLGVWVAMTIGQVLFMTVPLAVILGILAARRGLLDSPADHVRALRRLAVAGIAIGWIGGALTALQFVGVLPLDDVLDWGLQGVHSLTGVACGVGYAAAFGLLAIRMQRRPGPVGFALQAVGKRSMTSYLLQSVVMAPLLSPWGFGVGERITPLALVAVAVGTWLATVAVAVLLERAGRRGPAEWLLRRLAYGHRAVAAPTPVTASDHRPAAATESRT